MIQGYSGGHWTDQLQYAWKLPEGPRKIDRLGMPRAVVVGALDAPVFHETAKAYAAAFGASAESVDGVGHLAPMEDPARLVAIARSLFASAE
jgi:pimeloyl-ACP methyl ester carboxylesterase